MAQFEVYEKGIEIIGKDIKATIDGMGVFKNTALKILSDVGLDNMVFDDKHWYSQEKWLEALKIISKQVGPKILFNIGKSIIDNAVLPPIKNIEDALELMDIAYHMNYRNKYGRRLYDPVKKIMSEGIGHYKYQRAKGGKTKALMICDDPYPCDYNMGIITSFSKKFETLATIRHADHLPCKKNGADSCTYLVKW